MSRSIVHKGVAVAAAALVMAGVPSPSSAVIGTGWQEVSPNRTIQVVSGGVNYPRTWSTTTSATEPGASYARSGTEETFKLLSTQSNRVEVRVHNDYRTGLRQFEGELRVHGPTDDESCMQIFGNDGEGATALMIRAYATDNGTLRGLGKVLATNVYGRWLKINVVHDATADTISIYVGGSLVASGTGPDGDHYFKYGVYGTLKTASAHTQWRNVRFFQK
jgi:hypothetical protein